MSTLLSDTNTYEVLQKDPTPRFKRELTEMIRWWQREDPIHTPQTFHLSHIGRNPQDVWPT